MTTLVKLAWRNVWRNRRRSLLTISAIVFSTIIITLASSFQAGTYEAAESNAIGFMTGEIQVHAAGYNDEPTLTNSIDLSEHALHEVTDDLDWIDHQSKRLLGFGLISSDSSSAGGMIIGIEPDYEQNVSAFSRASVQGEYLERTDERQILIGSTLAQNLNVSIGDTIAVLTQGYRSAMGADLYRIKGLIDSGSLDLDRGTLVMRLEDAQDLFAMPGRITHLVLRTEDPYNAPIHAAELKASFEESDIEVMTWEELMPELMQTRALDDAGNYVFYTFLLLLIGFEIFNTTTMSVMERIREFGILQSIGLKPYTLSALVFIELSIKVLMALVLSAVVITGLFIALKDVIIPLPGEALELYKSFGFMFDGIKFSTRPNVFVFPFVSVFLVSLFASIYPSLKVYGYSPVTAMRKA